MSPYLIRDEKISAIARELRAFKTLHVAAVALVSVYGEYPCPDVRFMLYEALNLEAARRVALSTRRNASCG